MKNVVMYSVEYLSILIWFTKNKSRKSLTVGGVKMLKSVDVFNVF